MFCRVDLYSRALTQCHNYMLARDRLYTTLDVTLVPKPATLSSGRGFQRAISGSCMLPLLAIGVGTPGIGIGTWGCALVRIGTWGCALVCMVADVRLAINDKRSRNKVAATSARAPSTSAEPEGPRYEVGELDWHRLV